MWLFNFYGDILLQEHNELIQGIILKNRHLKDIIGKKKTFSNYVECCMLNLDLKFFYCDPEVL